MNDGAHSVGTPASCSTCNPLGRAMPPVNGRDIRQSRFGWGPPRQSSPFLALCAKTQQDVQILHTCQSSRRFVAFVKAANSYRNTVELPLNSPDVTSRPP